MKENVLNNAPNPIFKEIKAKGLLLILLLLSLSFVHAQNDNANENATVFGGVISTTNNTTICLDGIPDPIYVTFDEPPSGRVKQWIITDDQDNILMLPDGPPFDLDGAPPGTCRIYHLSYNGIKPLWHKHVKNLSDLLGRYHYSNYIEVIRQLKPTGGTLEGGPFDFCVGDGEADHIAEGAITLSGNSGTNSQWVITDDQGMILGLPPISYTQPDFDGAGPGTCLVWHLMYEDGLQGATEGANIFFDLEGCFEFSNSVEVIRRQPEGGTLEGGPFEFCVGDGEADNITEGAITLSGNSGTNSQWVVTDESGTTILGLPPNSYTEPDFDGAGAGTCLVWHLSYEDGLEGLVGQGLIADLVGCFEFSNSIAVIRIQPEGGTLEGGPFAFTVGDNVADNIAEGAITLSGNSGTNSQWVVTDETGTTILGLPPNSYTEPDFDGAGVGTCLVWHLSYEDGLEGLAVEGLVADLVGCYSFSNSVTVVRNASSGRFAVYPNPGKTLVNVDLSGFESRNVNISLFSLRNVRVFDITYSSRSLMRNSLRTIDVSRFISGIYFVRVTDNLSGNSYIKRLVVN